MKSQFEIESQLLNPTELLERARNAVKDGDFAALADVAKVMMTGCRTCPELVSRLFSVSKKLLEGQKYISLALMAASTVVECEAAGSIRQMEIMGEIIKRINDLSQFSEQRDALLLVSTAARRNSPLYEECMYRLHKLLIHRAAYNLVNPETVS